jgi:hypothetical protein
MFTDGLLISSIFVFSPPPILTVHVGIFLAFSLLPEHPTLPYLTFFALGLWLLPFFLTEVVPAYSVLVWSITHGLSYPILFWNRWCPRPITQRELVLRALGLIGGSLAWTFTPSQQIAAACIAFICLILRPGSSTHQVPKPRHIYKLVSHSRLFLLSVTIFPIVALSNLPSPYWYTPLVICFGGGIGYVLSCVTPTVLAHVGSHLAMICIGVLHQTLSEGNASWPIDLAWGGCLAVYLTTLIPLWTRMWSRAHVFTGIKLMSAGLSLGTLVSLSIEPTWVNVGVGCLSLVLFLISRHTLDPHKPRVMGAISDLFSSTLQVRCESRVDDIKDQTRCRILSAKRAEREAGRLLEGYRDNASLEERHLLLTRVNTLNEFRIEMLEAAARLERLRLDWQRLAHKAGETENIELERGLLTRMREESMVNERILSENEVNMESVLAFESLPEQEKVEAVVMMEARLTHLVKSTSPRTQQGVETLFQVPL